jgi:hypothetical protein
MILFLMDFYGFPDLTSEAKKTKSSNSKEKKERGKTSRE